MSFKMFSSLYRDSFLVLMFHCENAKCLVIFAFEIKTRHSAFSDWIFGFWVLNLLKMNKTFVISFLKFFNMEQAAEFWKIITKMLWQKWRKAVFNLPLINWQIPKDFRIIKTQFSRAVLKSAYLSSKVF